MKLPTPIECALSVLFGVIVMAISAVATEGNFGAMLFWTVLLTVAFDRLVWD